MKPFLLCLLVALAIQGSATVARACQYCALAANDPEMAKLAAEMHAKTGGFPLDGAIGKFQPPAASATLTAAPLAASVATQAADLATTRLPAATTHRLPPPVPSAPAPVAAQVPMKNNASNRWANGGLLGLLGLAGVFGWRTRRHAAGSES